MRKIFLFCLLMLLLSSCGDDNSNSKSPDVGGTNEYSVTKSSISGFTQKGPFVSGSEVVVYELNDGLSLKQTGNSFSGNIRNSNGKFAISSVNLVSPYADIVVQGYYRNEVTGEKSSSPIVLKAITNLSDRNSVNVNILTHLEYERVRYLVVEKQKSVENAKKQSEQEIFSAFYIDADGFELSEDLDLFGKRNSDGALLALSILLLQNRKEADLTDFMTDLLWDFSDDGVWEDKKARAETADWIVSVLKNGKLPEIRKNIERWELGDVPDFEKHIENFMANEFGLGICTNAKQSTIAYNKNEKSYSYGVPFICDNGFWRLASDVDLDTAAWGAGENGEVRAGQHDTSVYYTFDQTGWRLSTVYEMETYGIVGKYDGNAMRGKFIPENCYVFEDDLWRKGSAEDCSLGIEGCTKIRQNFVNKGNDERWYTCDNLLWRLSTDIEKDTVSWGNGKNGEVRTGNVNESVYYIFDEGNWRTATDYEKDTYEWTIGIDGDSKYGNVNKTECYVFEQNTWRKGTPLDCVVEIGGCIATRQNVVAKTALKKWYVCENLKWRTALDIEKDTVSWGKGFNREVRAGNVNTSIAYEYDVAKSSWSKSVLNPSVEYAYVEDPRDHQIYRTVKIGSQTWFAENLNYNGTLVYVTTKGHYKDVFGVMYTSGFDAIRQLNKDYGGCYTTECQKWISDEIYKDVCMDGWHIATVKDWKQLSEFIDNDFTKIQTTTEWPNGTNETGLSIVPTSFLTEDNVLAARFVDPLIQGAEDYEHGSIFVCPGELYITDQGRILTEWEDMIPSEGSGMFVRCVKNEE